MQANPALKDKITVMNLCIANASGTLKMHGVPGSSMSQIENVKVRFNDVKASFVIILVPKSAL